MAVESIVAVPTDIGRRNFAEALIFGRGIILNKFSVGSGGHDPLDETQALTPDATVVTLPNLTFGPDDVSSSSLVNLYDIQFNVELGKDEAIGPLSNLGLYGTVISSPLDDDSTVGTTFLYAVANFPFKVKGREIFTFTITVNL